MDPATGMMISGGLGALGGLFGGQQQDNFGWGNQWADGMNQDVKGILGGFDQLGPMEYYPGQTWTPFNPMLKSGITGLNNQSSPGGSLYGTAQNTKKMGNRALKAGFGEGIGYLQKLKEQGPNTFQYDQGTFDTTMGNLMPGLQGSYDAAMRDPIRQFNEQTIPGINMGASGAGQAFGTRGANQTAIAARGLQDRGADTASQLWANAANQANAGAMAGGQMNLGSANEMVNTLTNGFQNYAGLGLNANNQGFNMQNQNTANRIDAGNMIQGHNEQKTAEDVARYNFNMMAPYEQYQNQLSNYNSVKLGGTPGTSGPSTLANILNGAQAGAGLYGAFSQYNPGQVAPPPQVPYGNQYSMNDPLNQGYQPGSYLLGR